MTTRNALLEATDTDRDQLRRSIAQSSQARFTPAPRLTPDAWIERYRKLSQETSAMPGSYSFAKFPPLRKIARDFGRYDVEQIIVTKPSQVGFTELELGLMAYCIKGDPSSILLVHTTIDDAKMFTKKRIKPMIRDTPVLYDMFGDESGRRESDDTLTFLAFPGGSLTQVGSNSAGGVSANPVRRVFCEEVGRWTRDGSGEGDTFDLAAARTVTFWNRMLFAGSSPGIEGTCRITQLYQQTNRQTWQMPCRDCRAPFRMDWRTEAGEYLLRCDKRDDGAWLTETAFYACPHCGSPYTERDKRALVASGEWAAEVPGIVKRQGFHIDGLLSPWVTWATVLEKFQLAKSANDTLKTFVNTVVGATFAPPSERISATGLMARAEPMDTFPAWVGGFTIGVDIQGGAGERFELLPVGWGVGQRSAVRGVERIFGDPASAENIKALLAALTMERDGMLPLAVAVDTGYLPHVAWQIVDALKARRIVAFAVKGSSSASRGDPLMVQPGATTRKGSRPPWMVSTGTAKDWWAAAFRAAVDGERGVAFSDELEPEVFSQFTAEELVPIVVHGQPSKRWKVREGMRNEGTDMLNYALAALHGRGARLIASLGAMAEKRAPIAVMRAPEAETTETEDTYVPRRAPRRGGFVAGWR